MNCKKRKGNHKFGFGGMMEMEDIKRVQLSEIVELITKGTTPTTLGYEFQDEGVNFFKIECFDENGGFIESKVAHISEECHKKMKRSQLKNGDILFSIAGAIGRVAIVTEEMLPANINQALAIIRISDEQVYLPYIKLILTSPIVIEQFERKKQGVAQLNLSLKDINEISIPLPGKDKQIELAELFDKVVGVISKRNKELSVLDDLIKARFVEMFGDPIINSFGIDTKSMTDVCEIIDGDRGKNYPTADEFSDEGYCLFLNAKNVTSTGFNFATCMFVTKEKDEVLRKGKLSRGDVVLTTRGTLGNLAFYTEDIPFEHVRINSGMVILRMKQDVVDEVYFIEQFKMQLADIREKIASGSAQPQLPISAMNKINILTPNIEKQRQFADFVRKVDKSKVVEIIN
jgi:type I restriction enzyme S subunit